MTDSTTPRRISERKNKGVPSEKFSSFELDMGGTDRTPPPQQEPPNKTATPAVNTLPGTSAQSQWPPSTEINFSQELEKKMDEVRED